MLQNTRETSKLIVNRRTVNFVSRLTDIQWFPTGNAAEAKQLVGISSWSLKPPYLAIRI